MSANPDLKECHIDKAESSLVEFVAAIKQSFEDHRAELSKMPHENTADWAKNLLRSSQDVKCPDACRQQLIEDLRGFVKDVRKVFTKYERDLNSIPVDPIIQAGQVLLDRSGYEPPRSIPPRRMSP